jgi:ElaB/YqjD/DUF883 family membrane-anchored ribosome-binding protein
MDYGLCQPNLERNVSGSYEEEELPNERTTRLREIEDAARERFEMARDMITSASAHARDVAQPGVESLAAAVRNQPLTAVLIATAAGYLIARLLRK